MAVSDKNLLQSDRGTKFLVQQKNITKASYNIQQQYQESQIIDTTSSTTTTTTKTSNPTILGNNVSSINASTKPVSPSKQSRNRRIGRHESRYTSGKIRNKFKKTFFLNHSFVFSFISSLVYISLNVLVFNFIFLLSLSLSFL